MQPSTLNSARRWIIVRQMFFAALSAGTMLVVGYGMYSMLRINGFNVLKGAIFALFLILLSPIVLSFWTAVLGFAVRLFGGGALEFTRALPDPAAPGADGPLTAVVVPVYNEDPVRVFAGLKATYESLEETGFLPYFEFFILSDTTDPDTWIREEMALQDFRQAVSDPSRIYYRNRRENVDRKTGNIADFCAGWGGRYRYMIVFDADSIMTGTCLTNLVRLMENYPNAGIIQAPPLPVNRNTFFGRMRQFATHAYSSVFITGLNFWQGGAANYWGHNAIIRIQPFIEHCRLPKLSGPEPLGGSILSHDFVEAAFMRRAGWKVYLATELGGSYEEVPPSLISYAARDRRWCQGNMQHMRLLLIPGLHPVNRLHLCLGVMAYLAAPLWMLMLLVSTIEGIRESIRPHPYFPAGPSLYPIWTISVEQQAIWLFVAVMCLLMAPKALSLLTHLFHRKQRAEFGGGGKLALSVFLETIASTLLAPVLAFLQTHFVTGILMGRNVKWEAQDRGEPQTGYGEAVARHWPSTLLGIVWSVLLLTEAPKLFWWFSPVLLGFLLVIPMSVWSSRVSLGEWARKRGLFLTPEEAETPPILLGLERALAWAGSRQWAKEAEAVERVLHDPDVRAVHLSLLEDGEPKDDLRRNYIKGLELKYQHDGAAALTPREKRDLLWDEEAIQDLLTAAGTA
ncbi:MAG TPA: glucans biosynthesis glucosyltransferase MdoH [Verrucomicrobiae bacterium]|jgi:membrane glycosyltransferase